MIILLLAFLAVSSSFGAQLSPKRKTDINLNPARKSSDSCNEASSLRTPLGKMSYSRSLLSYLKDPTYVQACRSMNSKKNLIQNNLKYSPEADNFSTIMTLSLASFDPAKSGFASFVPLAVDSNSYEDLIFMLTQSADYFSKTPQGEFFIHFDDAILDWTIRLRRRLITYTSTIPLKSKTHLMLMALLRHIHEDPGLLANFDGLSLRYFHESNQLQVNVLTRFEHANTFLSERLNSIPKTEFSFIADADFRLTRARAAAADYLRNAALKVKGYQWKRDPRFLRYMPLIGHASPITSAKSKKPPTSPPKRILVTTTLSASSSSSTSSETTTTKEQANLQPARFVAKVSVPLKLSQSPTITGKKAVKPATSDSLLKGNFDFSQLQNIHRKEIKSVTFRRRRVAVTEPVKPEKTLEEESSAAALSPPPVKRASVIVFQCFGETETF